MDKTMTAHPTAVSGVNGREKVLMAADGDTGKWHWWVHEYDNPRQIIYRSRAFETGEDAASDVEEKAATFRSRRNPVIYQHRGKWFWQYTQGEVTLLDNGPFQSKDAANHNWGMLSDLLLGWGGE